MPVPQGRGLVAASAARDAMRGHPWRVPGGRGLARDERSDAVGDGVIRALERNHFTSFDKQPLLDGQLVLVLDADPTADVCDGPAAFRLIYDLRRGLLHERLEDAGNVVPPALEPRHPTDCNRSAVQHAIQQHLLLDPCAVGSCRCEAGPCQRPPRSADLRVNLPRRGTGHGCRPMTALRFALPARPSRCLILS